MGNLRKTLGQGRSRTHLPSSSSHTGRPSISTHNSLQAPQNSSSPWGYLRLSSVVLNVIFILLTWTMTRLASSSLVLFLAVAVLFVARASAECPPGVEQVEVRRPLPLQQAKETRKRVSSGPPTITEPSSLCRTFAVPHRPVRPKPLQCLCAMRGRLLRRMQLQVPLRI